MRYIWVVLWAIVPAVAHADEVTDQINEAVASYKAGKYAQAASDLEFAVQQIRQKQAEQFKTVFPAPPKDWDADEPEVGAVGMAMMGGAISAQRQYHKKGDPEADLASVEVSIVGESPMLQATLMMITNPMMAGAGGKPIKLGSTRAFMKQEKGSEPEITAVVANKLLVTIKGGSGATEAEVMAIAKSIDFAKLEKLVQN